VMNIWQAIQQGEKHSRFQRQPQLTHPRARLSIHDAKGHLEHFCACLPTVPYADIPRPEYILEPLPAGLFKADVVLPHSVNIAPRRISGRFGWKGQKMATKEAAFRAYVRLYEAGLINKNLLPEALPDPVVPFSEIETEEEGSVICVRGRTIPWTQVFGKGKNVCRQTLTICTQFSEGEELPCLHLFLPTVLDISMAFGMFWTNEQFVNVEIGPERFAGDFLENHELLSLAHLSTQRLFESIFLGKMQMRSDLSQVSPFLMVPFLETSSLQRWLTECTGDMPADNFDELRPEFGLIRLKSWSKAARPYLFRSLAFKASDPHWVSGSTGLPQPAFEEAHFEVKRLPRRLDYLHPPNYKDFNTSVELVPAADCYVDRFPTAYAKLMLLLPSILHKIELRIVAMALNRDVLSSVGFQRLELVENAICASAANESCNYQRLELIGDSILKFWTSALLCAQFPGWHEGYLSRGKDRIVSNSHLCRASRDHGLDEYIHTEPFASSRWRLPIVDLGISDEALQPRRNMSSKVLADVVEALIGASFLDGRDEETRNLKVKACLAIFLGGILWRSPIDNARILKDLVPKQSPAFDNLRPLTEITGFSFDKKILLIEALTHPSYPPVGIQGSYQRLEFLGDSILDFVVVETMSKHSRDIPHFTMHLIRAAVVNAHLLAFFCLGAGLAHDRAEVTTDGATGAVEIRTTWKKTYLWEFMKHSGKLELLEAQRASAKRYDKLKLATNTALDHGRSHPWYLLLSLSAEKFFSDTIESILGAIFIDSGGNLQACKEFLERLGLMKYLRRIIEENIDIMHPKERLGIVAGNAKVRYEIDKEIVNDTAQYSCTVFVDGESTAMSAGEVSKAAAEAKAAQDAVELLSKERGKDNKNECVNH
jgi:dsRNA-specific ribonuclease